MGLYCNEYRPPAAPQRPRAISGIIAPGRHQSACLHQVQPATRVSGGAQGSCCWLGPIRKLLYNGIDL